MVNKKRIGSVLLTTLFFLTARAYAADITALGGLNLSSQNTAGSPASQGRSSPFSIGATIALLGSEKHSFQIETGFYYVSRLATSTAQIGTLSLPQGDMQVNLDLSQTVAHTMHSFIFPLAARYRPFQYISVAAGPYYLVGAGNIDSSSSYWAQPTSISKAGQTLGTASDFQGWQDSSLEVTQDYGSAGLHNNDYGLLGNIRLQYPVASSAALVAEATYFNGVRQLSKKPQFSFRARDILLMSGLQLEL